MHASGGDGTDPGDEIVDAVLTASRALVGIAARSLAAADHAEVSLAQYRILVLLASGGPRRIAALAESLGVAPSSATRLCERLARKGLVRRRRARDDRREVHVSLSEEGRALVDEVTARRREEIAQLVSSMPPGERDGLIAALRDLARAAGEPPEPEGALGW